MIAKKLDTHFLVDNGKYEYYCIDKMPEVHAEMLVLLKIINKICTENNILFWLDGGSLIGAVRHNGFIPWDDDMDISLLKNDYLKLLKKLEQYCKENKDVFIYYSTPQSKHCCNFFASKRVQTRMKGSLIPIPVKIDIRPLNVYGCSEEDKAKNLKLRDTANQLIFGRNRGYITKDEVEKMITEGAEKFLEEYNNNYGTVDNDEKHLLAHPYFEFSDEFSLQKENIFPLVYINYEDTKLPIPKDYDLILTNLYGKYMELPPIDNRAPVSYEIYCRGISADFIKMNQDFRIVGNVSTKLNKLKNILIYLSKWGPVKFYKILINERR